MKEKTDMKEKTRCYKCNLIKRSDAKWYHYFFRNLCRCHGNVTIPELEEMKITELNQEDYLLISDTSEGRTKKLKFLTLIQYVNLHSIPQIETVLKGHNLINK